MGLRFQRLQRTHSLADTNRRVGVCLSSREQARHLLGLLHGMVLCALAHKWAHSLEIRCRSFDLGRGIDHQRSGLLLDAFAVTNLGLARKQRRSRFR